MQREDLRLADEGHLEVDLGVLGLAVGAQVLVAEAAGDLEVAVDAGHHEDLLEQLRATAAGRRTAPGADATGHEVVARALRRRLDQHRRLDLEEARRVEVRRGSLAARWRSAQVVVHAGAAQVEVAVLEAQRLVRRRLSSSSISNGGVLARFRIVSSATDDLDLAGRQLGVDRASGARATTAAHGDHELGAHVLGQREASARCRG